MEVERKAGRSTKECVVTVSTRLGPDRLEISIHDTGPGIALEDREKVFEPLFSTKPSGIGLGMPIVQHILDQHGGGVEINSEPGEGTEIVLWVPVNTQEGTR
jgi:two-component system sensor histidine kinase HydH